MATSAGGLIPYPRFLGGLVEVILARYKRIQTLLPNSTVQFSPGLIPERPSARSGRQLRNKARVFENRSGNQPLGANSLKKHHIL
jgi:hypothetical protein